VVGTVVGVVVVGAVVGTVVGTEDGGGVTGLAQPAKSRADKAKIKIRFICKTSLVIVLKDSISHF